MKKLVLLLLSFPAFGAVSVVTTPGDWALYRGTAIVSRHATLEACVEAVRVLNVARSYTCRTTATVVATTIVAPPPPPPTETWTRCAAEGEVCQYTGIKRVRYGAGTWAVLERAAVNGGIACDNETFGDPIRYTVKTCEISNAVIVTPPPPVTGSATVSWNPVTQNTDNTPAAITGYRIIYGTSALDRSVQVSASTTSHTITGLPVGTYQFSVVALSASSESLPGTLASKVIP